MADIRIKDLATTASTTASDDFLAVDGTTNGTRKLSAATPSFATSVTVPGVVGPTSTDLTLTGGSTGASLVLGQGASANVKTIIPSTNASGLFSFIGGPQTTDGATIRLALGGYGFLGFESLAPAISAYQSGVTNFSGLTFETYLSTRNEVMRLTPTRNLLIGTTTDMTGSGGLKIAGTTAATSYITGALQSIGGAGINGAVWADGTAGNTLTGSGLVVRGGNATFSTNIAEFRIFGGTAATTAIAGDGSIRAFANVAATNTTTGSIVVGGGIGVSGAGYFGGNLSVSSGVYTFTGTTVGLAAQNWMGSNSAGGLSLNVPTGNAAAFSVNNVASLTASSSSVNVPITTSASSSTVGALTIGNGTAATNVAIGGGNVNAGGTLVVGNTYANSAKAFIFGTLKVGGDAGQATGTIVLGDDQSSGTNVGLYRGQSSMVVGGGNWLNLAGYDGVNITAGAATFGSQTKALSITSTAATFAGAVSIGNTVGTAAAVASTHKVTMVIGGVTYYLLATNV